MFKNPGKFLKDFATTCFIIDLVCALIGCIIAFSNDKAFMGLIIIAVGFLVAFFTALFLFAFGELVDTNIKILETNNEILRLLQRNVHTISSETDNK